MAAVLAARRRQLAGGHRTATAHPYHRLLRAPPRWHVVLRSAAGGRGCRAARPLSSDGRRHGARGILQSAGLLFFAFAGYARIATLAEEVRDPATDHSRGRSCWPWVTIVGLPAALRCGVLAALGPDARRRRRTARGRRARAPARGHAPLVRVGASAAALGALLALIAGRGTHSLAMARERDLPGLAGRACSPALGCPTAPSPPRPPLSACWCSPPTCAASIGFSSCGVLVYYPVANLGRVHAGRPTSVTAPGLHLSACSAASSWSPPSRGGPWPSALAVLAVGAGYRAVRLRIARRGRH